MDEHGNYIPQWKYDRPEAETEMIDQDTGCANALHFVNKDGKDVIVGTNREIDEVALYTISE